MSLKSIIAVLLFVACHGSGATNPAVLPENPGLDGGEGGHWGKQAEPDWVDNRWNQTDIGPFMSCSLKLPNGTIAKGLSIRIGEKGEAAVCFDTASVTLRAGWTGDFLKFDPARYGLINMPKMAGEIQFLSPSTRAWGDARVEYIGFHQNGRRVTLCYRVNDTPVLDAPWYLGNSFLRDFEIAPHNDEKHLALIGEPDGQLMVKNGFAELRLATWSVRVTLDRNPAAKLVAANDSAIALSIPSNSETQRIRLL